MHHLTDHRQDPVPGQPATRVSRWLRPVESLYYRDFRLLWGTSFLSSAAKTIQQISLGWIAFDLSGSPLLLVQAINPREAITTTIRRSNSNADTFFPKLLMVTTSL